MEDMKFLFIRNNGTLTGNLINFTGDENLKFLVKTKCDEFVLKFFL